MAKTFHFEGGSTKKPKTGEEHVRLRRRIICPSSVRFWAWI